MAEQLPPHVRAKVTGAMPVRDSFSKESVKEGGIVRLLPRTPGQPRPPANTVLIDALVSAGAIEVLPGAPPKTEKTA